MSSFNYTDKSIVKHCILQVQDRTRDVKLILDSLKASRIVEVRVSFSYVSSIVHLPTWHSDKHDEPWLK